MAIPGQIRGTSKEKLYRELDLESLQRRRWFRKLCTFYEVCKNQSSCYLCELLPLQTSWRITISHSIWCCFYFKYNVFKNSCFRSAIIECKYWIKKSLILLLISILQFLRPSPRSLFNFINKRVKHLTKFLYGLSHLSDHKLRHGFLDSLNLIYRCWLDIRTTCHRLLFSPNFMNERSILLNTVPSINKDTSTSATLLFSIFSVMVTKINTLILNTFVAYSSYFLKALIISLRKLIVMC